MWLVVVLMYVCMCERECVVRKCVSVSVCLCLCVCVCAWLWLCVCVCVHMFPLPSVDWGDDETIGFLSCIGQRSTYSRK